MTAQRAASEETATWDGGGARPGPVHDADANGDRSQPLAVSLAEPLEDSPAGVAAPTELLQETPVTEAAVPTLAGHAGVSPYPAASRGLPVRFAQAYPLWRGGKVRRSDGRLVQAYIAQRLTPCFMPGCSTLIPPGSLLTLHGRGGGARSRQGQRRGPGSNPPVPCCWVCQPFALVSAGVKAHLAILIDDGQPVRVRLRGRRYATR